MDTLDRQAFLRCLELDLRHCERMARRERKLAAMEYNPATKITRILPL